MAKLTAKLVPNDRKYYGTIIELEVEGRQPASIEVWINSVSDGKPSSREYDFERDGKFYTVDPEYGPEEYEICDDHYETATALQVCNKIVEALNGMEVT